LSFKPTIITNEIRIAPAVEPPEAGKLAQLEAKTVTETITKPLTVTKDRNKGGRPKKYGSNAERQRAFRQRKAGQQ